MNQTEPDARVIFVTGDPGVGKSTLSRKVSEHFRLPLFMKDDFKESLMDIVAWTDKESTRAHGGVAYAILYKIIEAESRAGRSFIIETPFQTGVSSPTVKALQDQLGFKAMEILCLADPEVIYRRLQDRAQSRHPGHFDEDRLARLKPSDLPGRYDSALKIDSEIVELDLSDFDAVDYEVLWDKINSFLSS